MAAPRASQASSLYFSSFTLSPGSLARDRIRVRVRIRVMASARRWPWFELKLELGHAGVGVWHVRDHEG